MVIPEHDDSVKETAQAESKKGPVIECPAVCTVKIEGAEIRYSIYSVRLEQDIYTHHTLTVILRQDAIGNDMFEDPTPYTNYLGKSISLSIDPEGGKVDAASALEFIGIVTEVRFENSVDEVNMLRITASSPTIAMDGARKNSFSFDKSASDIAGAIVRNYPITVGKIESTSGSMPFCVQYRETDFEFVMRLAASGGKFAFYDGKKFSIMAAGSADEHELKWRENLGSFSLGLGTTPANFSAQLYNYEQNKDFSQDTSSISGGTSLSSMTQKSADASTEIFSDSGYSNDAHTVNDAQSLDVVLTNEKKRAMGQMLVCRGLSIVPLVVVGHCVKVTGMDKFNQQYWVTKVVHKLGESGKYHNKFECTPLDIAYPTNPATPARVQTHVQTAKVVDNADPDQLGRIKVKFPWNASDETVWIRFLTPHAGQDRGWFVLPEIDDEVLVVFEHGNPSYPVALGSLYNKGALPHADSQVSDNNVKMFTTKAGNQIKFTDESGSEKIEITQGDGKNGLVLDLSGPSISFTSDGGDITLTGNNITIEADSEIKLKAGTEFKGEAGSNMTLKASASQKIEGSATVDIKGGMINLN